MGKDHHTKGQKDQKKSRKDSTLDIILSGGSSPHYKPPKGKSNHKRYKSGWDNARKKS